MAEKQLKIKDMIIAIICTLLVVLAIIFYFLPAFSVQHSPSLSFDNGETVTYSAWQMTEAVFTSAKDWSSDIIGLMYIKDVYGMAVALSGILMPLSIVCAIVTTVFAYLSWFKGEKFKKFCFLFSLCGMVFATITLIATWFIAIQLRNGNAYIDYFSNNIKGSIAYASFVSLILAFVIAIVACAYNYFLDNFDDEDDEEDEDEEDDDEDEEEEEVIKPKKVKTSEVVESKEEEKKVVAKEPSQKKTTTKTPTKSATKSTTAKSTTAKKTATK